MPKHHVSGGLLMYRIHDGNVEVLLAHPGGPFFTNKDDGVCYKQYDVDMKIFRKDLNKFTEPPRQSNRFYFF